MGASAAAYRGIGMEGMIAKWYVAVTRKGMEEYRTLAREIASGLNPEASVLEVAPGPGFLAIEIARLGPYRVSGLDISRSFVAIARQHARESGVEVDFRLGNASDMPFDGEQFDFLVCRAAFKNFAQPVDALCEMRRVLKPGGQALIIDLRRDSLPAAIRQLVDTMGLHPVNRFLTRLTFRHTLLRRAYTRVEFEKLISQTGFQSGKIEESPTGLEVRLRK